MSCQQSSCPGVACGTLTHAETPVCNAVAGAATYLAKLTFLGTVLQYMSSKVFGHTGVYWELEVANQQRSPSVVHNMAHASFPVTERSKCTESTA